MCKANDLFCVYIILIVSDQFVSEEAFLLRHVHIARRAIDWLVATALFYPVVTNMCRIPQKNDWRKEGRGQLGKPSDMASPPTPKNLVAMAFSHQRESYETLLPTLYATWLICWQWKQIFRVQQCRPRIKVVKWQFHIEVIEKRLYTA